VKTLGKAKIHNFAQALSAIAALENLSTKQPKEDPLEAKIRKLERELIGCTISGYYNTPSPLAAHMVELAQVKPGEKILEPSAGKGDIASQIAAVGAIPHCIEIYSNLRQILQLKGFPVVAEDVMEYREQIYSKIVMNPPFQHQIEHVQHCFDNLLKPEGVLVTIMSESIQFRSDKKHAQFREWLSNKCVVNEPLPDDTFLKSDQPTRVKTRLLMLEK
jgi:protein-L-isoaspartate O-methyltransferase